MTRMRIPGETIPPLDQTIVPSSDFSARGRRIDREFHEQRLDREMQVVDLAGQWDHVLTFFGTDAARENFIRLCTKYKEALGQAKRTEAIELNEGKLASSDSAKAAIHNEIMDILRRLYVEGDWHKEDHDLLMKLQERDVVEAVIDRVFQAGDAGREAA